MAKRIGKRKIRKLYKHSRSYAVTIPVELIRALRWQKKQRVEFRWEGKRLIIEDYD